MSFSFFPFLVPFLLSFRIHNTASRYAFSSPKRAYHSWSALSTFAAFHCAAFFSSSCVASPVSGPICCSSAWRCVIQCSCCLIFGPQFFRSLAARSPLVSATCAGQSFSAPPYNQPHAPLMFPYPLPFYNLHFSASSPSFLHWLRWSGHYKPSFYYPFTSLILPRGFSLCFSTPHLSFEVISLYAPSYAPHRKRFFDNLSIPHFPNPPPLVAALFDADHGTSLDARYFAFIDRCRSFFSTSLVIFVKMPGPRRPTFALFAVNLALGILPNLFQPTCPFWTSFTLLSALPGPRPSLRPRFTKNIHNLRVG